MQQPALSAVERVTLPATVLAAGNDFHPHDPKLFCHRRVQFLHRVAHVLARFLERVELGLLIRRQKRANLRHGFVHDRLRLLHRVLMNRDDLWFGLIKQRLNLGLLVRREVQRLGQMLHGKLVPVAVSSKTGPVLRINQCEATQRNRTRSRECK